MRLLQVILVLLALVALSACESEGETDTVIDDRSTTATSPAPLDTPPGESDMATATISAPADTTTGVTGAVTFTSTSGGVRVEANLSGLAPGEHGIHLHETASCARADHDDDGVDEAAGAAGDHYDPRSTDDHGAPGETGAHLGDLGNVTADADGRAATSLTVEGLDLSDVRGRALVIHSGRDDLETDPAGDSGDRVGCGVVEALR